MQGTKIRSQLASLMLSFLFIASPAIGQTHVGSLTLSSQAEVDAFDFVEVTGTLTITGADIVDLGPLDSLTTLGGSLSIDSNTTLGVVDAFHNLTTVGSGIYVYRNPSLVSIDGFGALEDTGDNIDFWYNDSLETISGFGMLHTAGWSLEFGGNPALVQIPQFESLLTITSSLFVLDNTALPSITGFNALESVGWSFDIVGNTSLDLICGFYNFFFENFSDQPWPSDGRSFNISANGPGLPDPMSIQDIIDGAPCPAPRPTPAGTGGGCAAVETSGPPSIELLLLISFFAVLRIRRTCRSRVHLSEELNFAG